MSQFFTSGSQSTGVSVSASVLPMNIQDLFPLGWTGWISLQSKGLSRVFSNTTAQSINSAALSFLYSPTLTSICDYWENHQFPSAQSLSHVRLFATPWTSMPGLPVHHQLPEPTQTHVHCVSNAIQPSHPLLSPSPPAFNLSQHQGLFQ